MAELIPGIAMGAAILFAMYWVISDRLGKALRRSKAKLPFEKRYCGDGGWCPDRPFARLPISERLTVPGYFASDFAHPLLDLFIDTPRHTLAPKQPYKLSVDLERTLRRQLLLPEGIDLDGGGGVGWGQRPMLAAEGMTIVATCDWIEEFGREALPAGLSLGQKRWVRINALAMVLNNVDWQEAVTLHLRGESPASLAEVEQEVRSFHSAPNPPADCHLLEADWWGEPTTLLPCDGSKCATILDQRAGA